MLRTPLWATASLLAVAISLAGCGDDKAPAQQAATPPTTSQSEPAARTDKPLNAEAAESVVSHYPDLAHAMFRDAHSTAVQLQKAIDALLASPRDETLQAAKDAWLAARVPYLQTEVFRSVNPVV